MPESETVSVTSGKVTSEAWRVQAAYLRRARELTPNLDRISIKTHA